MKPFKHIYVPVDFSKYSDRAVRLALVLAEQNGAEVTLVHAMTLFHSDSDDADELREYERMVKKQEARRMRLLQQHNKTGKDRGVTVNAHLIRGFSAPDTLLEFARENDFDLIVMGTHGRTGLKKWVYGSVAEKIVRLSPLPVLTTQHDLPDENFERLLVPVDFSEHARHAVNAGVEMARLLGAKVDFLHVIDQGIHPAYYAAGIESRLKLDPDLEQRSKKELQKFTGTPEEAGDFTILEGRAFEKITAHAKKTGADMIVMATRGLSGLDQFLIGSTTERVVPLAPCPVLTVGRK